MAHFTKSPNGWTNSTQIAELTASGRAENNTLGEAVAISANTIVAGAPGAGAIDVFMMPPTGWQNATQTARLSASGGGNGNYGFGSAVAISANTIVAGAPVARIDRIEERGTAYVFTMPSSGWANTTQAGALVASDGTKEARFGTAVAISENTIVAGAPHPQVLDRHQGAAYVFAMPAAGWQNETQTARLSAALAPLPPTPTITALHQSASRWHEPRTHAQGSRKKGSPLGTVFSFSLNEEAAVTLRFSERLSGRKVKGKCVAQTRRNRGKAACKRTKEVGALRFIIGQKGTNKVAFEGRVETEREPSSEQLKPGRYKLVVAATDTGDVSAAPKALSFTIVR